MSFGFFRFNFFSASFSLRNFSARFQLMNVVVNAKFKDSMYYKWAMWMMNGPRKMQPKSGNFVAADWLTIRSWCTYTWKEEKKEIIFSGVKKCYMSADPGPEFDVEPAPENMNIDKKSEKEKKKIVAVKSKLSNDMEKMAKKKQRARKKKERALKKLRKENEAEKKSKRKKPKRKATPNKKNPRKSPKRRVVSRKTLKQKKKRDQKK